MHSGARDADQAKPLPHTAFRAICSGYARTQREICCEAEQGLPWHSQCSSLAANCGRSRVPAAADAPGSLICLHLVSTHWREAATERKVRPWPAAGALATT